MWVSAERVEGGANGINHYEVTVSITVPAEGIAGAAMSVIEALSDLADLAV